MNIPRAVGLAEALATSTDEGVRAVGQQIVEALGTGTSGNDPVPFTYVELAVVLKDMAALVEVGDSFEGSIEYLMPEVPEWAMAGQPKPEGWEDPEVLVRASYRIGNSMGQGGVRIIGTMGGRP